MQKLLKLFYFVQKDLLSQKKLNSFFVFNLVLGFLGFLLLQVFQVSLDQQTKNKAQEILGGDIVISARRLINEAEVKTIEDKVNLQFQKRAKSTDFFAMIKFGEQSRLVLVRSVGDNYPLYGNLEIKNSDGNNATLIKIMSGEVYVDPELVDQLKITDLKTANLKVGDVDLKLEGVLTSDPSRTFRLGALAPFILISEKDLAATNLVKAGSTVTTSFLYKLNNPAAADSAKTELEKNYLDPSLRFSSALQEEDGGNRVFRYLIDYLGLVSLISIGLCFLCLSYMLNWFFQVQKKTIAIYKILGMPDTTLLKVQVLKNLILSISSFKIALVIILLSLAPLQSLLDNYFKIVIRLTISPMQIFISFLVVVIGPQLIAIPTYLAAMSMNPLILLRQEVSQANLSRRLMIAWVASVALLFWGLAVWQSHSIQTGSVFIFGLLAATVVAWLFISSLRKLTALFVHKFNFELRYAFLSLIRKPGSTDLIFMTMTLSVVVLTLLPHIKKSIVEEVRPEVSSKIPSVFMFDIQMDQKDELIKIVKEKVGQDLDMTPLVRSRILKINDQSYERVEEQGFFKTRESENEARFRNRGVNLTYKANLQDSEELLKGKWFSATPGEMAEISLEEKYAERIGAKIGDVMTFDVQGLEIKGKVASIRRVRWTSFQPNFFITFQPGFLEEAPQVYLSAVNQINQEQVRVLQNAVVDRFANISIINVKQSVEKSLVFIDQMALALQIMATLALVVGFFIFIILINTQVGERINEMNLLQVLGSTQDQLYRIMITQFSLIAFLSLLVGLGLGSLIAYVIMAVMFKLGIYFDYVSMLSLIVVLVSLTFGVLKVSMRPLRNLQPLALLKNEGGLVDGK
ncbi:hypothetical protein CIK05_14180 [Bdellovibrio sp. qaytius]|nr:hypothetical protein CIK05_14180 [Bdellovibrio sp. qaytius]